MQLVKCQGTPTEIGVQHGEEAAAAIQRGLLFYKNLFQEVAGLSWEQVCGEAIKFMPMIHHNWPEYFDEMDGIALGAEVGFESILAMNIRTEIAYGLFNDGCTAISSTSGNRTLLAQNWDWQSEQAENIIRLKIRPNSKPDIDMITEAGIIGKIGLNSVGVGVCLNAIRAKGVDYSKLPVHLALRACLDSISKENAVERLIQAGVASSCHILVADSTGGVGLECSHRDIVQLPMSDRGIITHTNHFVEQHPGVEERINLLDSPMRLARINHLLSAHNGPLDANAVEGMLKDEEGYPVGICREETEESTVATLFSIVMELHKKAASVTMGRPVESGGQFCMTPM
ncbi:hypothetical protein MMC30_009303 [Trapelia coarctata]|nr:hypothetical protein [Trapelia coarctata]